MSFWGITAFFNPTGSRTRIENLRRFVEGVRAQGLKLMIVEMGFGNDHPEQSKVTALGDHLLYLQGGALCWQKERMLGIGLNELPLDCDKVGWIDGDILFLNDGWLQDAENALDAYPLIQLFDRVVSDGESEPGMVAHRHMTQEAPQRAVRTIGNGIKDACYGRSGYAWAARREVLDKSGFYDRCIVGGGDAVMGYAAYNRIWPTLEQAKEVFTSDHFADVSAWVEQFHGAVQGNVGFIPGTIVHLDHGSKEGRGYQSRTEILKTHKFTPSDLKRSENGPWEWATPKHGMHAAIENYFERRAD